MKLTMDKHRIKLALKNLALVERNCNDSGSKFEPSLVVCAYLTETLLPTTDIYDPSVLRTVTFQTIFNDRNELGEYLDATITRLKRNEGYALTNDEIETLKDSFEINAYDFLIDPSYQSSGQIDSFLKELLIKLNTLQSMLSDPRRSDVKIDYSHRILKLPLIYIASVLEALSIGLANV